jgi:hypothetical protein
VQYTEELRKKMSEASSNRLEVICSNGMTFSSITEAARWVEAEKGIGQGATGIQNVCCGRNESCGGFRWRYFVDGVADESRHEHPIDTPINAARTHRSVCCSNGMRFRSISDAQRWVIEHVNSSAKDCEISKCCRGLRDSAYGFRWCFEGEDLVKTTPSKILIAAIRATRVLVSKR